MRSSLRRTSIPVSPRRSFPGPDEVNGDEPCYPHVGKLAGSMRAVLSIGLLAASLAMPAAAAAQAAAPSILTTVQGFEIIRLEPDWNAPPIGSIRAGQSVRLAHPDPVIGPGVAPCRGGWYRVQPRGYVCVGWQSMLGGSDDPQALAAAEVLPDRSHPTLFRVGVSLGAPRYLRLPTPDEQRRVEKDLDRRLARQPPRFDAPAGPVDATAPEASSPLLERYFSQKRGKLTAPQDAFTGMKVTWAREMDAAGRTWLVTPNLELIPKDKVRIQPTPELHGIDLRHDHRMRLPLAFLWLGSAPKYRMEADGRLVATAATWSRHDFVPLTGETRIYKHQVYLQTRDDDYIRKDRVTTITAAASRPRGVGPKDKWVGVRVTHGYLVAYEGDTPVFATAISPGADGALPSGRHVTKLGLHVVQVKSLSLDMSGFDKGKPWRVEEVPWVAVYKDDYALHGTWWHNDFGRPKSHGCINMAPLDARFLFDWLDPALPEGWYSVGSYGTQVKGTVIDVSP
jgi:hypothetical protein